MAISTYKTFLMYVDPAAGSGLKTYKKLIDIKDYPDLGGTPEMLDSTTLSNKQKTYIVGVQDVQGLEFTANYTKADYTTIKALEGKELELAVWFGGTEEAGTVTPDGSSGKFEFKGALSVYVVGGGVNEVVDMKISIAPSTEIKAAA